MKKFATLLLAAVLALSLAACGGGKGGLTVEEGKLHMSTNAEFPPYEMVTNDGGFEGIDVEVAGLIAEKLGLELVVDDMGFTAALE
ncbi:MAG: transporter substrate-binding domain-containing protein, partial [Oscillospiraceae bacterium]|nr:transporter substrate-binding domain-containing protein [Oscillospiraceae bacterium]